MPIGKRKLKEISCITIVREVLEANPPRYSEDNHWWNFNPSTWADHETELFDFLCDAEDRMRKEILQILGVTKDAQ